MIGRLIAWLVLVLALVALGRDAILYVESGAFASTTLNALWSQFAGSSLSATQQAVEGYAPFLWQWIISPVLLAPAWLVLFIAGLVLWMLFGRYRRRRWKSGAFG